MRELHGALGYEASGVNYTFGSVKGLLQTAKAIFFNTYKDDGANKILNDWRPTNHGQLVQIGSGILSPEAERVNHAESLVAGD